LNKLELVREYYLRLRGCCLTVDVENALNKAVGAIAYVQSVPDEDDGCAILVAQEGFYTLIENQDYSGHG
jgi:hypothetical protein